ncbi:hypothetical protein BD289DRAFT_361726 [Coniella lustricola]|uniref:WKF domain-containing protein n=1 Tax=Coniella lustricola TaxID=2025994 RepID=A0A2T3AHS4_9PEZI|nr:hypothetical protein BD289DRAFT_361726 [Coniella lustricola]
MSAVPAWKRLGLKLKGAASDGSPVSAAPRTATASAPPAARQYQQQSNVNGDDYNNNNINSRKSVSFSEDTKKAAPKKPKQKKAPKQPTVPKEPFDFTPVVQYLRTWCNARDSWKFNKNHQTLLIKHLYNDDAIPASDIDSFYLYISDIKGASRKRLVEEAEALKKKDMEAGSKGFPESTKAPEDKQKQYEEILAEMLAKHAAVREKGKRGYDEVEFVQRGVDAEVQKRVVKRLRAENVILALESTAGESDTEMSAPITEATATSNITVPKFFDDDAGVKAPKQKTRRRKRRTDAESSSGESDSDSDSDSDSSDSDEEDATGSSSSSSSSGSGSDEDIEAAGGAEEAASSSSSSSSSESGSDSESESADVGKSKTASAVAEDSDSSDSDSDSD